MSTPQNSSGKSEGERSASHKPTVPAFPMDNEAAAGEALHMEEDPGGGCSSHDHEDEEYDHHGGYYYSTTAGVVGSNHQTSGWLVTSCDVGTTEPQSLSQELERLQVLKSYHILDPDRDESFDRLTTMASRLFGTPYTFISLVDMGRIWFRCNPNIKEGPQRERQREGGDSQIFTRDTLSYCSRVILRQSKVFVITDTHDDERFQRLKPPPQQENQNDNSSSSNDASSIAVPIHFRFYAGAPLVSPEGYRLGAFVYWIQHHDPRV
jgi:hypothetical protein